MIHGKSLDPVSLKKINLRLWSLSDEIATTVHHYLSAPTSANEEQEQEEFITQEYIKNFYEGYWERLTPTEEKKTSSPHLTAVPAINEHNDHHSEDEKKPDQTDSPQPTTTATPSLTLMQGQESEQSVIKDANATASPASLHRWKFKRQIPAQELQSQGQLLLFDLQFDQISIFSNRAFAPGQEIVIEFEIPRSFAMVVRVLHVKNYQFYGRIISNQPFYHRIVCHIEHRYPGDVTLLRQFLASIDQRPSGVS